MGSVNWGQLAKDAGDIQPVPVGKYDAIITECELKTSQNGREYWAAKFKIQNGPQAGRTLYNNFVLVEDNPNALRAFFINMSNLGISVDQLTSLGTDKNALTPLLIGRQALVQVTHREYQGQMRDNIDRVERHPSGPFGVNVAAAPVTSTNPGTPPAPTTPAPGAAAPTPSPWDNVPTPSEPVQAAPVAAAPGNPAPAVQAPALPF